MTSVTSDPRIGTELAGYRIEALIGRGGMSTVYRAEDLTLGRKAALKLISPELAEDESFRERFRAEWRLAASIDHPNVIPIHEAGESEGTLFIAMRYVEGTDLKALLDKEGGLEPARALNFVSQAAAGLDAAHDKGLVHRDVKPSNVLISFDRDGEHAYLADFGLTKPASNEQEARESIQLSGTTDYVSPEQIADGTAEARSDIYALGAVLYESLTGEVPYPRDRKLQVLFAHVNDPPPKPAEARPELPEGIDTVIATAMAKEPEDRYKTGVELAEAATAVFPEARRPWWQIAGAAAVLLLAIAAAVAIPAVLLTQGSNSASQSFLPLTGDSLVRIDREQNQIAGALTIPGSPAQLAVDESAVWVAVTNEKLLLEVDSNTGALLDEIDVSKAGSPASIAADNGTVWLGNSSSDLLSGGALWEFDVSQRSLTAASATEAIEDAYGDVNLGVPSGIVVTDDAVWASCELVFRVDPNTSELVTQIDTPTDHIVASDDAIWLAKSQSESSAEMSSVQEIDPTTNEIVSSIDLDFFVSGMTWAEDALWVSDGRQDSVSVIDPETGEISRSVRVGRSPSVLTAGSGAVWVGSDRDGTVTRIDPETLDLRTIDVGGTPLDIETNEDGVWVTVRP